MDLNCSLDLFIVHFILTPKILNHFLSMNSVHIEANHHLGKAGPSLF